MSFINFKISFTINGVDMLVKIFFMIWKIHLLKLVNIVINTVDYLKYLQ